MIGVAAYRTWSLRFAGLLLVAFLFQVACTGSANADTTYTYTGNPFTTFKGTDSCTAGVGECQLSFSFTLASPLPANFSTPFGFTPLSFSITDGANTFTNLDPVYLDLFIETGPVAQIDEWFIQLSDVTYNPGYELFYFATAGPGAGSTDISDFATYQNGCACSTGLAFNTLTPGTWTATPEPSSLLLLGGGLLGLGLASGRKWGRSV